MARSTKFLLYKHEDLRSDAQGPHKMSGRVTRPWSPSDGNTETSDSLRLADQPASLAKSVSARFNKRLFLKT